MQLHSGLWFFWFWFWVSLLDTQESHTKAGWFLLIHPQLHWDLSARCPDLNCPMLTAKMVFGGKPAASLQNSPPKWEWQHRLLYKLPFESWYEFFRCLTFPGLVRILRGVIIWYFSFCVKSCSCIGKYIKEKVLPSFHDWLQSAFTPEL